MGYSQLQRRRAAADHDPVSSRHASVMALLALVACLAAAGYAVFRHMHRNADGMIDFPDRSPAADATGAAGWIWPDGVPGWKPGQTFKGYPVSGVQPVEVAAAQLAAARAMLDADGVRVLVAIHPSRKGVLAILAAPTLEETPAETCLAALFPASAPVVWRCPGPHQLSHAHVLAAAVRLKTPGHPLYLVGVARGDVDHVEVVDTAAAPGSVAAVPTTLYERGRTWGELAPLARSVSASTWLLVYGHGRLLESVPLDIPPGQQRVLR